MNKYQNTAINNEQKHKEFTSYLREIDYRQESLTFSWNRFETYSYNKSVDTVDIVYFPSLKTKGIVIEE